jgi:hypothetical protein
MPPPSKAMCCGQILTQEEADQYISEYELWYGKDSDQAKYARVAFLQCVPRSN